MTFSTLRILTASLLFHASMASAARTLFVGNSQSFGQGSITAYSFDESSKSLQELSRSFESDPSPTWQTIYGSILYSVSETNNGKITAYRIGSRKNLSKISSANAQNGPVSIAVAKGGSLLITADYGAGGVSTFTSNSGYLNRIQGFTYTLEKPGPVTDRQNKPYPHQAVVDTSGKWVVVPDLGADLLRVYKVNDGNTGLSEAKSAWTQLPAGFGPRHGVFYPPGQGNATHFFLVGELANSIATFKLEYGDTIGFKSVSQIDTFNGAIPNTNPKPKAGEIALSPDGKYLYVSNRLDKTQAGNTQDSIAAYQVSSDGSLKFIGFTPSGGVSPRHFTITKDGKLVVIANDQSGNFAIFSRDPASGKISSSPLISKANAGASCATWYE